MKTTLTNSAPGLVAVTIAAAIAFAPAASATPIHSCLMAQTPWDPKCSVTTCPTATRPTRRTASWTCRANHPRVE